MGTTSDWLRVLGFGLLYGVASFAWDALTRSEFLSLRNIMGILITSGLIGMTFAFEWRVLRSPISLVFGPMVVALILVGLMERQAGKKPRSLADKS